MTDKSGLLLDATIRIDWMLHALCMLGITNKTWDRSIDHSDIRDSLRRVMRDA